MGGSVKVLWAPWRMEYILSPKGKGCFICDAIEHPDEEETLVLHMAVGEGIVLLNRYPYNPGHILVAPMRHVANLGDLSPYERGHLMELLNLSIRVVWEVMNPEGFNVGMNLGKVAGAGLKDHLHLHLVPRWGGDTNFMPLLADVKVVPEHLKSTYGKLRRAFQKAIGG